MAESIGTDVDSGELNVISNASLELLEQHQAKEQARLLQRFREMRQWQQQQQQQLMQQQQQQLQALQVEQNKVQSLIATHQTVDLTTMRKPPLVKSSPPEKSRSRKFSQESDFSDYNEDGERKSGSLGAGISTDSGLVSMQDTLKSQSSMPKPVMYVDPSRSNHIDEDDRYTSSELFSNPGCADDMDILKQDNERSHSDWMSESSENFLVSRILPPQLPVANNPVSEHLAGLEQLLNTAPAHVLQQMLHILPDKNLSRGSKSAQVELSASPNLSGPITHRPALNMQPDSNRNNSTPNLPLQKQLKNSNVYNVDERIGTKKSQTSMDQLYHSLNSKTNSALQQFPGNTQTEIEDEWYDSGSYVDPQYIPRAVQRSDDSLLANGRGEVIEFDDSSSDIEESSSIIDLSRSQQHEASNEDDRPITGTAGQKSFEQLLEEQLSEEKEKSKKKQQEAGKSKRPFLKKGQGIARFNSPPKKPANTRRGLKASSTQSCLKQETETSRKGTVANRIKSASEIEKLKQFKPTKANKESQSAPSSKLKLIRKAANRKIEEIGHSKIHTENSSVNNRNDREPDKNLKSESVYSNNYTTNRNISNGDYLSPAGYDTNNKNGNSAYSQATRPGDKNEKSPSLATDEPADATELDSLAEFELLEEVADNMSFCSNSSLFHRLVAGDTKGHKEAAKKLQLVTDSKTDANKKHSHVNVKEAQLDTVQERPASDDKTKVTRLKEQTSNFPDQRIIVQNSPTKYQDSSRAIKNIVFQNEDSQDYSYVDSEEEEELDENFHDGKTDSGIPLENKAKAPTRKIAPFSSKFTQANDTLNILKALSMQANYLTSTVDSNINKDRLQNQPAATDQSQTNTSELNLPSDQNSFPKVPQARTNIVPQLEPETETENQSIFTSNFKRSAKLVIHGSVNPTQTLVTDPSLIKSEKANNSDNGDTNNSNEHESHGKQDFLDTDDKSNDDFDDETEWLDEEEEVQLTLSKSTANVSNASNSSTPPTSKLVSRLFPKLRQVKTVVQPLPHESQAPAQETSQANGVHSHILREKLAQLETEIEKFRTENASLERLRREREEGLSKLKQEIGDFQREKEEEIQRMEEFKTSEMKKLKREKKLFDAYQKKVRSMPDKKDREEIEKLKTQLEEVQAEMRRKESRWLSTTTRLKDRLAEVEMENGELKEEVRILEKKRLEWMSAQASSKAASRRDAVKPAKQRGNGATESQPKTKLSQNTKGAAHEKRLTTSEVSSSGENRELTTSNTNSVLPTPSLEAAGSRISGVPSDDLANESSGSDSMQRLESAVPIMMENTLASHGLTLDNSRSQAENKSAAVLAMEKAVVEKGDQNDYTEVLHTDGKTEKTYKTGAKEIKFPNGTVKEISCDGQTIVCRLANGDVRQIFPDHRVVYIFAQAEIMQTTFPDGLETFQFNNGQVEKRYPDGTTEITFPSKDVKYLFPDGGQEVILTDGTVMQYSSSGERTVEYPSGDREIHTTEYQRREFPDGIVKTVYSDGRHETRFPNGRIRMRDKAGNVIMDQIVSR